MTGNSDAIHVDPGTGVVSGYTDVIAIADQGTLHNGGTPFTGAAPEGGYAYTVSYTVGRPTGHNENVRVDTVKNARPGIELYKTDWGGEALAGAVFTLKNDRGEHVAASSYTSDQDGLITIAYLGEGTFYLTETRAPRGYVVLDDPIVITVDSEGRVSISGVDPSMFTVDPEPGNMQAIVHIKDRPTGFLAKKVDSANGQPVPGVHFALYWQVTNSATGQLQPDYNPYPGFEDIVSDENGTLPGIDMELPAHTYYLRETQPAEGYTSLEEDLCFTIGADGTVTIVSGGEAGWLDKDSNDKGEVSYILSIPNSSNKDIRILKVHSGTAVGLRGAAFALYRAEDYDDDAMAPKAGASPLMEDSSNDRGILDLGIYPHGEYRLIETQAPDGYLMKAEAIKLSLAPDGVIYDEGAGWVSAEEDGGVYTLTVNNSSGYELPATGGPGTLLHLLLGGGLSVFAALPLLKKRRA